MEHSAASRSTEPGRAARTLVWIDARDAFVVRWQAGDTALEHLESDVPAHHKSTGHVGHDPGIRHGGGGRQQTAGDPHRLEHLARFVEQVAARIPDADDLLIIGPGTVREHLERVVAESDEHHRRSRSVAAEPAPRLTERQLIARLRAIAGDVPKRRTVGAYRWTSNAPTRPSRAPSGAPSRVVRKPPERVELEAAVAERETQEAAEELADEQAEPSDGPADQLVEPPESRVSQDPGR